MPLTPKAIYRDFVNGDLDKSFAAELLITLIDNSENMETRIESLRLLNKIQVKNEKTYKFLEHLIISDSNEDVRVLAISILKNYYIDRALDPMVWALEHETSLKCQINVILTIGEIETSDARSVLIKKIQEEQYSRNRDILKEILENTNLENIPNTEIAELLINYYVISFLKEAFGYFKFKLNKFGKIAELDLSNIERYSAGVNKLENFLEPIFSLNYLRKCDLRFNHLIRIPEVLNNSIKSLDLSYNKLVRLPNLRVFTVIKNLNLKSNRLRILPKSIGSLLTLEHLNLRNNLLKTLPKALSLLSSLKALDLHGNKLYYIRFNLNNSIKELELGWNNFKTVPKGIKSLLSLKKLGLGGNRLVTLPEWIGKYHSLKQLDLYDNKLITIPKTLGQLKSLERLNLRNNRIKELPSSLINLKFIKMLNLSWNNITSLPKWIGELSSLEELNLWGNRLNTLPKSIRLLSSLKILDLNFNRFDEIPPFLKEIEQVRGLIIKI